MADLMTHLKKAAWTEAEVGVIMLGGVVSSRFLDETKIFKDAYAKNPTWFTGSREGAPFYIKWSGGIKALGALTAATYVKNPWAKLLLMGVALHGTLQQTRVLTYDKTKGEYRVNQIGAGGNSSQLDAELRRLAEQNRGSYSVNYPGDRYSSAVGASSPGSRYQSSVGRTYDDRSRLGFSFQDSDFSTVGSVYQI